ncbi:hypothetical protein Tco_0950192 [Tanacetum coccineum]
MEKKSIGFLGTRGNPPGSVPDSDHGLHVSANATDYKYDPKLSAVKDCSSREQSYKHQPTDKAVGTNVASNVRNNNGNASGEYSSRDSGGSSDSSTSINWFKSIQYTPTFS